MKYQFNKISTVEDILKAIGRADIPSTEVSIERPAIDEETGEYLADLGIDFGKNTLSTAEETKLKVVVREVGYAKEVKA